MANITRTNRGREMDPWRDFLDFDLFGSRTPQARTSLPAVNISEDDKGYCLGACEKQESADSYNDRVLQAIASLTMRPSYVVLDKGLTEEEVSCIMVVKGSFFGMGYLPRDFENITEEAIKEYIKPYKENSYIRTLLNAHISKFPEQIKHLPE